MGVSRAIALAHVGPVQQRGFQREELELLPQETLEAYGGSPIGDEAAVEEEL